VSWECDCRADTQQDTRLQRLWRRCIGRALGDSRAEGVAYGNIGFHVD